MQKQKMKEWVRDGTAERVRKLSQNGITQEDLNEYHKKGYEEGYLYASEAFLKKIYAAIAKELLEAGNDKDDIYSFIHGVDQRFALMYDADDEVQEVFDQIGVRINLHHDGISTIEVV
jgi:hypothetical protein